MDYILYFDICSILLAISLLFIIALRKNYMTTALTIFILTVLVNLISSGFDILTVKFMSVTDPSSLPMQYLANTIYHFSTLLLVVLFTKYSAVLVEYRPKAFILKYLPEIIMGIVSLLLLSNPISHFVFYFDREMSYVHGFGYYVMVALFNLLVIRCSIIIGSSNHKQRSYNKTVLSIYVIVMISSFILQLVIPKLLIVHFVISVLLVLIYATVQRADHFMYKSTYFYNESALKNRVLLLDRKNISRLVVGVSFEDYGFIERNFDKKTLENALFPLYEFCVRSFGRSNFFCLNDGKCAIISDEHPDETIELLEQYFAVKNRKSYINLKPQYIVMNGMSEYDSIDDYIAAMNFAFMHRGNVAQNHRIYVTSEISEKLKRESALIHAIYSALEKKKLKVYYQPILDVKTGHFLSAEALVRMVDDRLGFLSPDEFIPIAEQHGFAVELGNQVFEQVCQDYQNLNLKELGIEWIDVNLSVTQCIQDNLPYQMTKIISRYNLENHNINFEVTESFSERDMEDILIQNVRQLKQMGFRLSLDDYGTGYSTNTYLTRLAMDVVKLDKSMLWNAMSNKDAMVIMENVVRMIHDLNKEIVVEGVETEEMAEMLRRMGVDYFQGYLYSRPVPVDELIVFLKEHQKTE